VAKVDLSKFNTKMNKLLAVKKQVMPSAYKEFVDLTPKHTGDAKRNTRLNNLAITAKYSYAYVLDKGRHRTPKGLRGSKQAPQGMTKPISKRIVDLVLKYVRKT